MLLYSNITEQGWRMVYARAQAESLDVMINLGVACLSRPHS